MTITGMRDRLSAEERPAEFVEGLAKGLAVLECFDAEHAEMTLSEIARRVGVSPSAARRSLLTLQALGYVGQTSKRFHLRPKVMSLGSAFYFSARVDEVLQPELQQFVRKFGDASSIATLQGYDVLYIAHYSEQRARRPTASVGARYPAFATSLGRVLLAGMDEADLDGYFAELQPVPLTSTTIVDKQALRDLVELARKQSYATTVDQLDYGITALAVPIKSAGGRTIAALNTSGYSGMITAEGLVTQRLQELRSAAARISHILNRYPAVAHIIGAP
ncbi:IclR family transcriptional regulator domain-containing protein [Microbaculum marinum]|uniref:IclR family transcriptional regulator C-terminal domain-containing protein n=1 Tax=Microbaculum marinum TaxID=1764581 RepID=A0AAW9RWV7_9HYPH